MSTIPNLVRFDPQASLQSSPCLFRIPDLRRDKPSLTQLIDKLPSLAARMGRPRAKRNIDQVDLTVDDGDTIPQRKTATRAGSNTTATTTTTGQRFGEITEFVPLSQSSQAIILDGEETRKPRI